MVLKAINTYWFSLLAVLAPLALLAQQPADTTKSKLDALHGKKGKGVSADSTKTIVVHTDTLPRVSPKPDTLAKSKVKAPVDTLPKVKKHSPKKATIMSAVLPGLGQVYNHHWWKVPIVYAGFGGVIYGLAFNQKYLNDYRSAYKTRLTQGPGVDPYWGKYTDANLVSLQQYYRRNRDLCYIILAGVYVLNILDANVSAHLFDFDVSDDLSLRWQPGILTAGRGQTVPGLSLSLRFK